MSALLAFLAALAPASGPGETSFERGVAAYRRGDYASARDRWEETLEEPLPDLDRARVYYDLGNAHWRLEESLPAIACYTAAVRLDPRHADAWRNLELARAKAGLPPADAGDLRSTIERALRTLRPAERRALPLAALVLWIAILALETRFGGTVLRRLLGLATVGLGLAAIPWIHELARAERAAPSLVIERGSVSLRSEPLEARAALGELGVLEEVECLDALPGWVRVERADGLRGWVREEALFPLRLGREGPLPAGG